MKPSEVAQVLAKCAAFDARTVGEADVAAWTEALHDVPLDTALAAVPAHYRDHEDRIKPSHIRSHWRTGGGTPTPPAITDLCHTHGRNWATCPWCHRPELAAIEAPRMCGTCGGGDPWDERPCRCGSAFGDTNDEGAMSA